LSNASFIVSAAIFVSVLLQFYKRCLDDSTNSLVKEFWIVPGRVILNVTVPVVPRCIFLHDICISCLFMKRLNIASRVACISQI